MALRPGVRRELTSNCVIRAIARVKIIRAATRKSRP